MRLGQRQRCLLVQGTAKTADVVCYRRKWYLRIALVLATPAMKTDDKTMGIDVGEKTLAATCSYIILGGEALRQERDVWLARRRVLQANGNQSALQRLRKASGQE